MKKYLLAILIFNLLSCEKFESPIYSSIQIEVRNKDGTDLLNPNTTDAYKVEGIKLFYLEGGILKEVYNENLALPWNFSIQQDIG